MTSISSLYLHSKSTQRPLRVGVMADSFILPAAFRQVLENVRASDFAELALVVTHRTPEAPSRPAAPWLVRRLDFLRSPERRRVLLYNLYQKLDRWRMEGSNPLEPVDCSNLLSPLARLDVVPISRGFVHRFPPEAIEALRVHDVDVLLRFGFNILRGDILTAARYGVWSYHHGDNDFYRGGPALLWELVENNPCSGVILQVLTEKLDDGQVLTKSIFRTERGIWRSRNTYYPYWGSVHFVIRKLHELHELGWETVTRRAIPPAPYQGKVKIYRAPSNGQMLRWLAPAAGKKLIQRLNPLSPRKVDHWRIRLARVESPRLAAGSSLRTGVSRYLPIPPGHFYADPFLLEERGQVWLFFEDFLYGKQRAGIACAPVQADLSIGVPASCLDLPYHLSYPFVFHHEGEIYMIPESVANHTVELWRASRFPDSWKLEKTLFSGPVVDTTPFHREGRWYFFATFSEPRGNGCFTALFHAPTLTADWTLHPSSPISTDVRHARSAGALLRHRQQLLRPVQDCSENYGSRIHVHEVTELNPDVYRERYLHSVEPDWEKGLKGVHTYSYCNGIEAVDSLRFENRRKVAPGP